MFGLRGPRFIAKTPKPVFNAKAVVSKENALWACFVLCPGDNALWRANTIQLPPIQGNTGTVSASLFHFFFYSLSFYVTPSVLKYRQPDPWEMSVGAARFAVYSFKDNFKFSGTFLVVSCCKDLLHMGYSLAAQLHVQTQAMLYSAFCPKWSVLKLQSELGATGGKAHGLCGQLCSAVIQCGTMFWSKEEESLSSGSKWEGWTQTVAEWRFLLWSLCLSVFFCSVSIWGQHGGEQQQSNESDSVPLNYPIKSAFYLNVPTHPVQGTDNHTHAYLIPASFCPCCHLFLSHTHTCMQFGGAHRTHCLCLCLYVCEV